MKLVRLNKTTEKMFSHLTIIAECLTNEKQHARRKHSRQNVLGPIISLTTKHNKRTGQSDNFGRSDTKHGHYNKQNTSYLQNVDEKTQLATDTYVICFSVILCFLHLFDKESFYVQKKSIILMFPVSKRSNS